MRDGGNIRGLIDRTSTIGGNAGSAIRIAIEILGDMVPGK
jgi:hypothetical protein